MVQPIKREDGTLAVSDKEIFDEMKKRYGKEGLEVKENEPAWYELVEKETLAIRTTVVPITPLIGTTVVRISGVIRTTGKSIPKC